MQNQNVNLYICSAGHSGSTLLDMYLGSHSMCESVGELSFLPMDLALNRTCGCGSSIRQCQLWSNVTKAMGVDADINSYALNVGFLNPTVGDPKVTNPYAKTKARLMIAAKYYQTLYGLHFLSFLTKENDDGVVNTLKVYDVIRGLTSKKVIVDSSKHYVKAASLYQADPDKTRIILLVRDGRGVFYSNLKRGFGKRNSLNAWRRHYSNALKLFDKTVRSEHILLVKYEEFVTDPEGVLSRICQFSGVDYEPEMLKVNNVAHHNVNGNDIKFKPIDSLRIDETWKTKLPLNDLTFFESKAGDLLGRFGYMQKKL